MSIDIVDFEFKMTEKIKHLKEYFYNVEIKTSKVDKEELKENYHFDFFNDKLESLKERKKELEDNLASNKEKYLEKINEQLENYENKIKFILTNNGQIFKDDDIRDNYCKRQDKRLEILNEEIKRLKNSGKKEEETKNKRVVNKAEVEVEKGKNDNKDKEVSNKKVVKENNEKENKPKVKDEVLEKLEQRLKEFGLALKYLTKYQMSEDQIMKAKDQCLELKKLIEKRNKGKEIEEYEIPLPPTSELICGMNKSKRDEKFKEIIANLISRKDVDVEKRSKFKASVDKMPESLKKRKAAEIASQLKDLDERIRKQELLITSIKDLYKNNYAPVPLTIEESEEVKTEKINDDIEENELLFEISNVEPYCDASFILNFEISEKNVLNFAFNSDSSKKYIVSKKVNIGRDIKSLLKNGIEMKVTKKYMCCLKEELGVIGFPLDHLGKSSDKIIDIMIKPPLGIAKYSMKLHTKIRSPILEKEYNIEMKKILRISKTYRPFSLTEEIEVNNEPKVEISKETLDLGKSKIKEKKEENKGLENENDKSAIKIDKSSFTQKEIDNPDDIDFLTSVKVLDQKIIEMENARAKAEGRCPPEIRNKLLTYKVKKKKLEDMYSDEDYDKNEIVNMLKNRLMRDEALLLYFRNNNMKDKEIIVGKRIPLIQKEIQEGESYLKNIKK